MPRPPETSAPRLLRSALAARVVLLALALGACAEDGNKRLVFDDDGDSYVPKADGSTGKTPTSEPPDTSEPPSTGGGGGQRDRDAGNGSTSTARDAGTTVAARDGGDGPSRPRPPVSCPDIDWTKIEPLVEGTGNVKSLRAIVQGGCLSVKATVDHLEPSYQLMIDADGDAKTGNLAWNWIMRAGADYLVQAGMLMSYTGTGPDWKWSPPTSLASPEDATSLSFAIPLDMLRTTSSKANIWIGFATLAADGKPTSQLPPEYQSFAQVPIKQAVVSPGIDRSACKVDKPVAAPSSRKKLTVSRGMIVPAYLPVKDVRPATWNLFRTGQYQWQLPYEVAGTWQVEDSDGNETEVNDVERGWLRLAVAAQTMKAAKLDFWVTVNGPNNGPLTDAADWSTARNVWNDLRTNGAAIFGYVHSCVDPKNSSKLIEADVVLEQIRSWVHNYGELDGIWLDEFFPRYELFDPEGASTAKPLAGCDVSVAPPREPNGLCATPVDRSFIDMDGCYDTAIPIQPAGGYYDTLIARIRAEFPWLLIVGNAGGKLYSNQLAYADLVDVMVGFEQSFAIAQSMPKRLERQPYAAPQAALFQGTSLADMPLALSLAQKQMYTHFYATDRVDGNVWGQLSEHLEAQVDALYLQN